MVFAAVMWWVLVRSPGWQVTRDTFLDPGYFRPGAAAGGAGLLTNIKVLAVAGVALVAVLLAALRSLRGPVFFHCGIRGRRLHRHLSRHAVSDRAVPDRVRRARARAHRGRHLIELLGTVALVLTYSSYVAEVLRAGIEAVHPSQRLAARSLGPTTAACGWWCCRRPCAR